MRLEHPLKKKYDRKCVPVRRVSAWEREQIEKRQKHLKEFKGQKWHKLHREDELRKAKAAAAGIRYVRLSSVRSSSTTPNKISRVATRRTRGVRFSARKKNPHKPREHLAHQSTKTFTNNKIAHSTYRPASKKYRFKREPPPPTPITLQNLKKFRMEDKRRRKGHDDDYNDFEKAAAAHAIARLHKMIAEEATNDALRYQVRIVKGARKKAPPRETNWTLNRAEIQLFQQIKENNNNDDIKLQSNIVQELNAALTPTVPAAAEEDTSERRKPVETELGQESTTGASEAPVQANKETSERRRPRNPDHGHGWETAGSSSALSPAEEDTREPRRPTQAEDGNPQEIRRLETSLDASTRHKQPPKSHASASAVSDGLDPPSPPHHATRPVPEPKPAHIQKQENSRAGTALDASARHKPPPKSQASASSVGDPLDPPSPVRPARQPVPELKPPQRHRQENARPSTAPEAGTRTNKRPQSHASSSSFGDRFDPPSPPHRDNRPIFAPKPPQGQRQENKLPGAPLDATKIVNRRPQSQGSVSSAGNRSDILPPPPHARHFAPAPKLVHLQRQENPRPSTAPEASARPHKRPRSHSSTSSVFNLFDSPSQPPRRPSAHVPSPPPRGRKHARTSTPPPPKRRRAPTPPSPERYLSENSPSPPPPRAPGLPPRPRFKALASITDKEDKASRKLMHRASEPLAKLSDAQKLTDNFEKVGRMQKTHHSFVKAKANPNFKHVRNVNRAGGKRREEKEVERDIYTRIGMPARLAGGRREERAVERDVWTRMEMMPGGEGLGGPAGAGQAQAGQAMAGQAMAELAGLAGGRFEARGESVGTGNEQTIQDLIAAQYGRSDAGGDDEL